MLLAATVGITLGILSARTPGGLFDRLSLGVAYLGISFPVYWVGLLLILLFAVTLRVLPPSGYGSWKFLVLPALALGMRSIAFLARVTRSAMLDALSTDYVRTARAKGLSERVVTLRHALRNAMIPIITDEIEIEKLSIYNQSILPKNPLNGARMKTSGSISNFDLRRSDIIKRGADCRTFGL